MCKIYNEKFKRAFILKEKKYDYEKENDLVGHKEFFRINFFDQDIDFLCSICCGVDLKVHNKLIEINLKLNKLCTKQMLDTIFNGYSNINTVVIETLFRDCNNKDWEYVLFLQDIDFSFSLITDDNELSTFSYNIKGKLDNSELVKYLYDEKDFGTKKEYISK